MNKETLEEAVERLYPINSKKSTMEMLSRHQLNNSLKQEGFIAGVTWQQERSYSEEEVRGMLIKFHDEFPDRCEIDNWFERFKKK